MTGTPPGAGEQGGAVPGTRAPYMRWAKLHEPATHDLTGSNLHPVPLEEFPEGAEALALHGPNDEGYAPLVEAIADRYDVAAERVCPAPGASGANFLAMAALVRPGETVLVERPGYDPLLGAARLLAARVRRFERRFEEGFQPDPDEVAAALDATTRLVVLSNLHNPSGVRLEPDRLRAIGRAAAGSGARVLVDEVYLETDLERRTPPAATLDDVFVSTNSLTKAFGFAGLRCGWALAAPEVAEGMRRARDAVDAVGSFPSDALSAAAFAHMDRWEARARGILEPALARLTEILDGSAAVEWVRSSGGPGGFPRLRGVDDAGPFVRRALEEHGLGLVPGRFFEADAHFRVAIAGEPARTAAALDRLEEALVRWHEGRG